MNEGTCEITSLDNLRESRGIATTLVEKVISIARANKCHKVIVVTTNDNINTIRFYQKRGFDLSILHPETISRSRKLKPKIPVIGQNGIPIKHEIEFEILLEN